MQPLSAQRASWHGSSLQKCGRTSLGQPASNTTPAIASTASTRDGLLPCYGGQCTLCGGVHWIPCTREAAAHARQLRDTIHRHGRLDYESVTPDPRFSLDWLYTKGPGRMLGVLIAVDDNGQQHVLKAFSGQITESWNIPGWVGPVAGVTNTSPVYVETRAAIEQLSTQIQQLDAAMSKSLSASEADVSLYTVGPKQQVAQSDQSHASEQQQEVESRTTQQQQQHSQEGHVVTDPDQQRQGSTAAQQQHKQLQGLSTAQQLPEETDPKASAHHHHQQQQPRSIAAPAEQQEQPAEPQCVNHGQQEQQQQQQTKQSIQQQYQWSATRQRQDHSNQPGHLTVQFATQQRQLLKKQRKALSHSLLQQIQHSYNTQTVSHQPISLLDVYLNFVQLYDSQLSLTKAGSFKGFPTGVGDCCAPKLLHAAALKGFRPVALAEVWCGSAPGTATKAKMNRPVVLDEEGASRRHLVFYGMCDKCKAVLGTMLCGVES